MKVIVLLSLFFLISCAHDQAGREIASIDDEFLFGDIDFKNSSIRMFPKGMEDGKFHYIFFLQLKDHQDRFIDIEASELTLKSNKHNTVEHRLQRSSRGKYYIIIDTEMKLAHKEISFLLNKKQLKEQLKLRWEQPSRKYSSLQVVRKGQQRLSMRLCLKDSQKRFLTDPVEPEIVIDGYAEVEEFRKDPPGCWLFDVTFPDQNQIFYISVRTHGAVFEKMLRIQHIEK